MSKEQVLDHLMKLNNHKSMESDNMHPGEILSLRLLSALVAKHLPS